MSTALADSVTNPAVKHDALLVFEAVDSNPNGDPDNAGKPRVDLETGHGLVSDVSLKRKVRDTVLLRVQHGELDASRYGIFIRRGVSLNEQLDQVNAELGLEVVDKEAKAAKKKSSTAGRDEALRAHAMLQRFYDVRLFGAVMSTGTAGAGKVTGPMSIGLGRSLHPVLPIDMGITRTASTREEDRDNASQMGNKTVVPYGLYLARVHYQPVKDGEIDAQDLQVFWTALSTMFELTRSAARPDMSTRGLFVFSHESPLGNAAARTLLDTVRITKTTAEEQPVTTFTDYTITEPDRSTLPAGITYTRLV